MCSWGHGEDVHYYGQNKGLLAMIPAAGSLDVLGAMPITHLLQSALSTYSGYFGQRGQEPSLSPTKWPRWLWLL